MKDKICNICKLSIDTSKEFAKFHHMANDTIIKSKAYYHINCFRERILGRRDEMELKKEAMSFIKGAKKMIGMPEEEVIRV
jgi:hypothetical protein